MSTEKTKKDPDKNLHAGHRERVREKFRQSGFDSFNDHEILELLLFYAIQRRDTNELAHKLINSCGSLTAVLEAPTEYLMEKGLSEQAALFLKIILNTNQKYVKDKFGGKTSLYHQNDLKKKLIASFLGLDHEKVILVLYDTKGVELFFGDVSEGTFSASELNIRRVTELAVKYHAASAVIAHNHPSGVAYPSERDVEATTVLKDALAKVGVSLIDHYIVASSVINSFVSDPSLIELFI